MSSFTTLLLVVAFAALLASCEARQHRNRQHARPNRRNSNDVSIALGTIEGDDIVELPLLQINGSKVILGVPDNNCDYSLLLGSEVIATNTNGISPPQLSAVDANDPASNIIVECVEDDGSPCAGGISVAIYQFCGVF